MTECKVPAAAATDPPSSPGACLVLGLVLALLATALPDAVLLPAVDRAPPRHLGLLLTAALLSAGWWLAGRHAARAGGCSRRALLACGAAAAAGGFVASWWLPWVREALAASLRGGTTLPWHVLVALACASAAAPVAVPLGTLAAPALGGARRPATCALLLGLALGLAFGPWLLQVLLGPGPTLQAMGLLAGAAALLLAERAPRPVRATHLPLTAAAALPLAGLALLVGADGLSAELDRGALAGPAAAAMLALAAAAGSLLPAGPNLPLLLGAASLLVPVAFPPDTWLVPVPQRAPLHELARLTLVSGPTGLLLGATLSARCASGPGAPLALAPLLLAAAVPLASYLALPLLPPRPLLVVLATPLLLLALPRPRQHALGLALLVCAAALALLGLGPGPPPGAVRALRVERTRDGTLALANDPATGQQLIAVDGRAPFGRSAAQMRRQAHIPLLLHGAPRRVLLVSSDRGEAATAAWASGCTKLHWLQPFRRPDDWDLPPPPGEDPPTHGVERQFFAVEREPYDAIVLAPDPRAAARGALLGTVEFFRSAKARLRPDGLLCQWWDLADVDVSDLKSVLAAAQEAFPFVHVLSDHPRVRRAAIGVLCAQRPLALEPEAMDAQVAAHGLLADDLADVGLDGFAVASLLTMDRGLLELFAPRDQALRDDRPAFGVRGALRAADMPRRLQVGLQVFGTQRRDPMPWVRTPEPLRPFYDAISRDRYRSWAHLYGGALEAVRALGPAGPAFEREAPGACPEAEAVQFLPALAGLPDWDWLRALVVAHARRLEQQGRAAEAEHYLRRAVDECDPASAPLRFALAGTVERRGDAADAVTLYRTVLAFDPQHAGARAALARLGAPPDSAAGDG